MLRVIKTIVASTLLLALIGLGAGLAYVQANGGKLLSVQSGSMVPHINKGDLVIANSVPSNQLATGDVITFISPANKNQTITHRIIAINGDNITTKGDANSVNDVPINKAAVIGKVGQTVPFVGFGLDFVRKPAGLILLIYLPALLIIIAEVKRLIVHYDKQRPYVIYGRRKPKAEPVPVHTKAGRVLKVSAILLLVGLSVAMPAQAALSSQATLTNSSIKGKTKPVKIKHIRFYCKRDDRGNKRWYPEIKFHNEYDRDFSTDGWYVESRHGRVYTFGEKTKFSARSDRDFRSDYDDKVDYDGDYMTLYDRNGNEVDSVRWGSNKDTKYRHIDYDTVDDWR